MPPGAGNHGGGGGGGGGGGAYPYEARPAAEAEAVHARGDLGGVPGAAPGAAPARGGGGRRCGEARATCRSARRSDARCTNEAGNQHAIRDHQSDLPIGEEERCEVH